MKQKNIPFKEKARYYNYQYNQTDRQEKLAIKKEEKQLLRKLKTMYESSELSKGEMPDA